MSRLPDFIIIGAMKCATSTLHEQLARQPGIFMSTPKEPNFFSNDEQWSKGLDWYRGLFDHAGSTGLCGESSTHYTKLPTYPRTIERLAETLPGATRFIYVMRQPIDRLASHYIHEWTQGVVTCPIDEAVERHPELIDYSRYAMQLEPFRSTFGPERVLPVFFHRLAGQPQAELERICRFLGYHGAPVWMDDLHRQNVSRERLRRSPLRRLLTEFPGSRFLRRRFVPQPVRDRIKSIWSMRQRPELSAARIAELTSIFDADLAQLGQWLGCELSCATFTCVGADEAPDWARRPEGSAA